MKVCTPGSSNVEFHLSVYVDQRIDPAPADGEDKDDVGDGLDIIEPPSVEDSTASQIKQAEQDDGDSQPAQNAVTIAWERVKLDKYNLAAWKVLLDRTGDDMDLDEARKVFEEFLKVF